MGDLTDDEGNILLSNEDKVRPFQAHNLVWTGAQGQATPLSQAPHCADYQCSPATEERNRKALARTKSNSAAGPDGISYRLLKLVKDTPIGQAVIKEIASWVETGLIPNHARDLPMVMIPKPGKDHKTVKGWRPIVLAQAAGKLTDKVIADSLQDVQDLFHNLQYGGRKSRSATDSLMISISIAERKYRAGNRVTILGKDIRSAFNHLRREGTLQSLRRARVKPNLILYVERFLHPRSFDMVFGGSVQGRAHMDQGTPQGSPLSPVLWLTYISRTLNAADARISEAPAGRRSGRTLDNQGTENRLALIFSYVDDVNPIIVTKNLSSQEHD